MKSDLEGLIASQKARRITGIAGDHVQVSEHPGGAELCSNRTSFGFKILQFAQLEKRETERVVHY